MKKLKSLPLAAKIFLGLALGIVAGVCFLPAPQLAVDYIKPFGTIFLNLIQFIVVPIVFFSIICGVISMKDIKKVGSVGVKTLIYYACTTAIAIAIGLAIANAFRGLFPVLTVSDLTYEAKEAPTIMETIVNIFPSNIIKPFADASMLQVIVASLFFGFAIILVGEKAQPFASFVESVNEVCMKIMEMIIALSPIGVFCLITPVVAENGQLTYTFTIQNRGNTAVTAADDVTLRDVFKPILKNITVTYNGTAWRAGTEYTYSETTGEFVSAVGQITVPAATYTQDPVTGVWSVTPGSSVLVITGTV